MFEDKKETFPKREERILEYWKKRAVFESSLEMRKGGRLFSFYDGPPFATGLPHYGHLLAGTIKDVIPRYKTMQGFYVPRRFGWDCHGLPVENEIEKAKDLSGAKAIENFGIANFNLECKKIVLRYTKEWEKTVNRLGRWVDFSKTYKTMDITFMESIWWVFKRLFEEGLVYEGFKVMPFSFQLGTPLSNFEANLNYKEVDDPSIVVEFESEESPGEFFLAWTTTPWTLISNLALMVGEDIDYVKLRDGESKKTYILAKDRVSRYFKDEERYEIVEVLKGRDLLNKRYRPLFSYFADKKRDGAFRVISEGSVSTDEGTGIVHTAPAFGEIDFFACKKSGIDLVCPVDINGRFTKEVPDFEGVLVKDADRSIIESLKNRKKLFNRSTIRHRYPFCWRSDTPLMYRAVKTWFVAVEKIKERLIAVNEKVNWVPSHIKHGRFGKWLENARDWAISRNRYWGTPIPIWRSGDDIKVMGSIEELEGYTGEKITDMHRDFIDSLTFEREGKIYKRVEEVFDCWFESGSMPYAQNHYPFENREETEKAFPADFIGEGLDQTRGWFYTLLILSTALFDKPAFRNVVVNGIILAEDGNKMSKRLKNYPEPGEIIDKFGSDALRFYMMCSPAVRGEDLCFSSRGVELVLRKTLIPIWNSYLFLSTYAKIYKWKPAALIEEGDFKKPENLLDRWILSHLEKLIFDVGYFLDRYRIDKAASSIAVFVEGLTNWYIRRSRARFWADEDSLDRREAFSTLYNVLLYLSHVAAPFIPFLTEAIYLEIKKEGMAESLHLRDFPKYRKELRSEGLEGEMEAVRRVVTIGHFLRKKERIRVRQPLSMCHVISGDMEVLKSLKKQKELILDELNVKDIKFSQDESEFVDLRIKPNFPVLGKKVGRNMKRVKERIEKLDQESIRLLNEKREVSFEVDGKKIDIGPDDVVIEREAKKDIAASGERDLTVVLNTKITKELLLEGIAREIVNKVNSLRKEKGFEVTDRIEIVVDTTDLVKRAFSEHGDYIKGEVLAKRVDFSSCKGDELDIGGEVMRVNILKV